MQSVKSHYSQKLEREVDEAGQLLEAAREHFDAIEERKRIVEADQIEQSIQHKHLKEFQAVPEEQQFADSIRAVEEELEKAQERLKKIYEQFPRDLQEKESVRYRLDGLKSEYLSLNLRLKREQARLAETALHRRADGADKEAEDRRKWNEALIRLQIAAQEKKMQSSAVKYEDVEKLNKLKEDLADLHSDTNEGVSRAA